MQVQPWRDGDRIVIVALQAVSRECLARVLSQERNVTVDCFSTLDDWINGAHLSPPSLVVLYQNGLSKREALNEVERFSELAPATNDCPAVVFYDNADPDLVVEMLGKNIRGYIPTGFSIDVVMHALDLVRAAEFSCPQVAS